MTDKEIRLINMINEHENPSQALKIAVETILSYLEQQKSSVEQAPADLPEPA